jgi:hypothetical protein
MLVAVAVIALDFGLVREAYEIDDCEPCTSHSTLPALVFVPSLSLLSVAAANAGLGLARRGWASPFATGYLLLGGLASLAVCLDFAAGTYLLFGMATVLDRSASPGHSILDGWLGVVLIIAVGAMSQIAFAMIGGGLASRYGVAIVLRGRPRP